MSNVLIPDCTTNTRLETWHNAVARRFRTFHDFFIRFLPSSPLAVDRLPEHVCASSFWLGDARNCCKQSSRSRPATMAVAELCWIQAPQSLVMLSCQHLPLNSNQNQYTWKGAFKRRSRVLAALTRSVRGVWAAPAADKWHLVNWKTNGVGQLRRTFHDSRLWAGVKVQKLLKV